jgi:hypothetical protein
MFVPAFGLGARYRVSPAIEVGAAWASAVNVEASGTGDHRAGLGRRDRARPAPDDHPGRGQRGGVRQGRHRRGAQGLRQHRAADDRHRRRSLHRPRRGGRAGGRRRGQRAVGAVERRVDPGGHRRWLRVSSAAPPISPSCRSRRAASATTSRTRSRCGSAAATSGSWGPGLVTLRGGVAYDTAAAKKNWERADLDGAARTTATLGASLTLSKVRIDLGGGIVHEGTRTQNTVLRQQHARRQLHRSGPLAARLAHRPRSDPAGQPTPAASRSARSTRARSRAATASCSSASRPGSESVGMKRVFRKDPPPQDVGPPPKTRDRVRGIEF